METSAHRFLSAWWSVTRAMKQHVGPLLRREHGVEFKDFMLLEGVDRGGMHPGQLCESLSLAPSAVSRMLDDASQHELVVRSLDPGDLRRMRVEITPKGRAVLSAARQTMTRLVGQWLKALPPAQARLLVESIQMLSGQIAKTPAEKEIKPRRRQTRRAR
jgi:DNA-binding MarR family transcriptional regulator